MFLQGHIVIYKGIEYIALLVDYANKLVTIGIPDPDNITRTKQIVNWRELKFQV